MVNINSLFTVVKSLLQWFHLASTKHLRVQCESDPLLRPYGMCLHEDASIAFPSGKVFEGEIWQHTEGARCIYAAICVEDEYTYFNLTPEWIVTSSNGTPVLQGM